MPNANNATIMPHMNFCKTFFLSGKICVTTEQPLHLALTEKYTSVSLFFMV